MPEKAVYTLTDAGKEEFEKRMLEISRKPINIFLKTYLEENIALKENDPDISVTGMAVSQQQFLLVQAIGQWIAALKEKLE